MPDIAVTDLQAATAALNAAAAQLRGDHKAMSDWSTTQGDTVTVKDEAGQDVLVPSLDYLLRQFAGLETDVRALIGDLYARPISEFYAERERNLAQFAASGFVEMGLHQDNGSSLAHINEGMYAYTDAANLLFLGRAAGASALGDSRTPYPMTVVAGLVSKLMDLNTDPVSPSQACIKFPAAPDGRTTYNRSTGEVVTHSSIDAAFDAATIDANVEVVTERVDVYGLEVWLEAITPDNPWVYPNGLIQSQASSMDGVATGTSTRPDSYYAVFPGDTSSRGKPVNLFAATPAQQAALLANPKHGIYRLADGSLVQKHAAQRTFAGPGNGDWGVGTVGIDSTQARYLGFAGGVLVSAQGARDTAPGGSLYESQVQGYEGFKGTFKAVTAGKPDPGAGVNGECYFLVLGTVPRLNQGCYHPDLNSLGSAAVAYNVGGIVKFNAWHGTDNALTSQRQCFAGPYDYNTTFVGPGRYDDTGSLSSASSMASGRPDGRFHDAIYPGGYGGVVDLRLESRQQTQADHARVDAQVKAGTYRGLETVKRTLVTTQNRTAIASGQLITLVDVAPTIPVAPGDTVHVQDADGNYIKNTVTAVTPGAGVNGTDTKLSLANHFDGRLAGVPMVVTIDTGLSVSGAFTWQTVIGNPANIAAIAALANGWLGDWCPVIPNGASQFFPYGRKNLDNVSTRTWTLDNGASWSNTTGAYDTIRNGITDPSPASAVVVTTYTVWADVTVPTEYSHTIRDGLAGLSSVWAACNYNPNRGACLVESLLGKTVTSAVGLAYKDYMLSEVSIVPETGALVSSASYLPVHSPVGLSAPQNNSPAIKALRYAHVDGHQANNCYVFAELHFDAGYDSANDFGPLIQPDQSQAWNAGQKYRIQTDDGVICVVCVNSHNGAQFQNFTQLPTGEWSISTGVVYFRPWYGPTAGWGDSGRMPLVHKEGTWTDDNGHSLKAGAHKLALPFGWA